MARVLGTLLILVLSGGEAAGFVASVPMVVVAVPLLLGSVAAMATVSATPLLVPLPFALVAFPLLCVPALSALS